MEVLHLNLKKKSFDMIASGEKKEEYREKNSYWGQRLCLNPYEHVIDEVPLEFKNFDIVVFYNGYEKNAPRMTVEFVGIEIGLAKPEWSSNWQGEVFIIKLGKIKNTP